MTRSYACLSMHLILLIVFSFFFFLFIFIFLVEKRFSCPISFLKLMFCHKEKRGKKVVVGEEEIGY